MNKELLIDAAAVIESFCRWHPNDMTPHEKAIPARLQAVINAPEQGLTDDEIIKIAMSSRGEEPHGGRILPLAFARAVLAAQRSKL